MPTAALIILAALGLIFLVLAVAVEVYDRRDRRRFEPIHGRERVGFITTSQGRHLSAKKSPGDAGTSRGATTRS